MKAALVMIRSTSLRARLTHALVAAAFFFLSGCAGEPSGESNSPPLPLRIYKSPYSGVDWSIDVRLKTQLHDHHGTIAGRIAAYDAAAYDVITLSDYSGNSALPYAWKSRRWPAENWLSPTFLTSLRNIKLLLPGAEEVGIPETHVTSTLLETYIERWDPTLGVPKQPNQYESLPELVALVQSGGGIPCIAHPWASLPSFAPTSPVCVEIYSAFAQYRTWKGTDEFFRTNRLAVLLQNWDKLLQSNQGVIGVGVNDHHGPYSPIADLPDFIRDSGKVIVLARSSTASDFADAFRRGAVFAIRDLGITKDRYPSIRSITASDRTIDLDTADRVEWISNGALIASGPRLESSSIPPGARYVRAEVSNSDGSTVYTQAFWVRPIGDVDGDYDIDPADAAICSNLQPASAGNAAEQLAACAAR